MEQSVLGLSLTINPSIMIYRSLSDYVPFIILRSRSKLEQFVFFLTMALLEYILVYILAALQMQNQPHPTFPFHLSHMSRL